jgi:hypothetical protein
MVRVTRYARWYANPDRDAYPQGYEELFAPFSAHTNRTSPGELLTEVATSEDTYLAFMQLDTDGIIRVFHRLRRMDSIMGGPQDAYSGKTIAVFGDVTPMGVVFCAVPANAFHRTSVINHVATAATIGTLIQQFPTGQVDIAAHHTLEPAQSDAAARSRFWMLIPPCFVGEVLSAATQPEGLMPRDLWENVVAPVVHENEPTQATIAPFIECKLCNVDDEVYLPDVWHDFANHGAKSDRRTLQYHMDLENPRIGTSGQLGALVGVSAALAQDLVNFRFIGPTAEYIGIGLSIFMVSYPTTGAIAALRESVALYDQQVDSVQSITVEEADGIRKRGRKRCSEPIIVSWRSLLGKSTRLPGRLARLSYASKTRSPSTRSILAISAAVLVC